MTQKTATKYECKKLLKWVGDNQQDYALLSQRLFNGRFLLEIRTPDGTVYERSFETHAAVFATYRSIEVLSHRILQANQFRARPRQEVGR
jgi:hypothetical protein